MNLKPCPFCGSSEVNLDAAGHPEVGPVDIWVICEDCGGNGAIKDSDVAAAEAWNRRHSLMRTRIEISKLNPPRESWRAALKIMEELGELSEAVLIDYGSLAYKQKEAGTILEVADVLNGIAAFLAAHYRDKSTDEIMEMIEEAGLRKLAKYLDIVQSKEH